MQNILGIRASVEERAIRELFPELEQETVLKKYKILTEQNDAIWFDFILYAAVTLVKTSGSGVTMGAPKRPSSDLGRELPNDIEKCYLGAPNLLSGGNIRSYTKYT